MCPKVSAPNKRVQPVLDEKELKRMNAATAAKRNARAAQANRMERDESSDGGSDFGFMGHA